MTTTNASQQPASSKYFMHEAFQEFLESEGVPIVTGFSADCLTMDLEPWERLGGRGAYVHFDGRSGFCSTYVAEIPAGGQLKPEQHLHDELIHVVSGRGATTVEMPSGARHTFEWGPGSIFGIPLNSPHQHFNGSGTETARFIAMTDLPLVLNFFHSLDFVFDNPFQFKERFGEERYFRGDGEFRKVMPGRHQWETNFVPDLGAFALPEWTRWDARGAGGRSIQFVLADSTMHSHISEFPSGTYKKAHQRPSEAGVYLVCVGGHGYTLLWEPGQNPVDTIRVDWKPGTVFSNGPGQHYHQHFNTSSQPSRYLAMGFGGSRHIVEDSRRRIMAGADKSEKEGGRQVEYEDEDPRILRLFEQELAQRGLEPRMKEFIAAAVS
jgi:mannose-6-phosphate isomerase-like protein (cupin superfamily)